MNEIPDDEFYPISKDSLIFKLAELIGRLFGPSFDVQVREIESRESSVIPFLWPGCY